MHTFKIDPGHCVLQRIEEEVAKLFIVGHTTIETVVMSENIGRKLCDEMNLLFPINSIYSAYGPVGKLNLVYNFGASITIEMYAGPELVSTPYAKRTTAAPTWSSPPLNQQANLPSQTIDSTNGNGSGISSPIQDAHDELLRYQIEAIKELYNNDTRVVPIRGHSCNHQWANYQGLSESFEYCKVCDAKR